jgi:HEAT repeat protein
MVEPLRAALRDEFAGVRERAVMALGHLGDKGALEEVLNLLGDENDRVRYFTAKVLGDLSDERAVPALRQAVKDYPDMAGAVRAVLASLK